MQQIHKLDCHLCLIWRMAAESEKQLYAHILMHLLKPDIAASNTRTEQYLGVCFDCGAQPKDWPLSLMGDHQST